MREEVLEKIRTGLQVLLTFAPSCPFPLNIAHTMTGEVVYQIPSNDQSISLSAVSQALMQPGTPQVTDEQVLEVLG